MQEFAENKIAEKWWRHVPPGEFYQFQRGYIVRSDALNFLTALREDIADVVFLDPPFNLGKKYGNNGSKEDKLSGEQYFSYMTKIVIRAAEVLKPGGALYIYNIPKHAVRFAAIAESVLNFRHWIAISMKNGFARGKRLYPAHYALLYFTKGNPNYFNRPKIPTPRCRHCGEFIKDYGGYKSFVQDGINLSDVWDDISPVRHSKYKHRASNELPLEIPRRVIKISGYKDGILVDPFSGTGSSIIEALNESMFFLACDREKESIDVIRNRLCDY